MYSARKRSKKNDRTVIRGEVDRKEQEIQRLHDLGEKFLSDKKELERQIEEAENASLPPDLKKKLLRKLKEDLLKLEEEYDAAVINPQAELEKEIQEDIYEMDDSISEMSRIEGELSSTKMDVSAADMASAAREVSAEQLAFEELKRETLERLNIKMRQKEQQARTIRAKNLRR